MLEETQPCGQGLTMPLANFTESSLIIQGWVLPPSTVMVRSRFPDAMYLPRDQAIAILAEGMVSNMDHHPNPLLSRLYPDSLQHSIVAHLDAR